MKEHHPLNFLQEKDFITWRLTGDPSLERIWKDYLELHPEEKEAFETAIRRFSHIKLNPERLTPAEESALCERIRLANEKRNARRFRLYVIRYAAAACILLATGLSFYLTSKKGNEAPLLLSENLTAGENLEKENICLITGDKSTSFNQDVHVQINKEGAMLVEEVGSGKSAVVETDKSSLNKLVVPYGKRSQLILPDGSKAWINSGSILEFPSSFTGNRRMVNLSGEMFIEVAKDSGKPFFVNTPGFQVKVYGTQFNISAYQDNDAQSVVLVSGSVSFTTGNKKETYLQPNEMLVYKNREIGKSKVEVERYISWKEGYLLLENTPITTVLKDIERYYNLTFEIPEEADVSARTCTGKLYLSDDPDNVLKAVGILASIRYTRDGKTIHLNINP